jgi:hypothetical protein
MEHRTRPDQPRTSIERVRQGTILATLMQTNWPPSSPTPSQPPSNQPPWLIPAYLAIVAAHISFVAPVAWLTILLDGLTALMIVFPPILAGLWFVPLFRLSHWPLRWQLLIAAPLGLGSLSLLILVFGAIGVLHCPVWITLIALMAAIGILRLRFMAGSSRHPTHAGNFPVDRKKSIFWLWLLTAPFLSASLLAACNPPGLIWSEEGYGYDVLEYHLQMPKEYFEAGRITYAPHNVYANFPSNVEMLYLLGMIVRGNAIEAGTIANFIHLSFAVLLVFAASMAVSFHSARAGIITAVSLGTVGWLPYLSGLAYVENAMLFFGMTALAFWLRAVFQTTPDNTDKTAQTKRDSIITLASLAGLTAGFACGCKYPALPLIAIPVALAWFLYNARWPARLKHFLVFSAACLLTASPWFIKNFVHTGNPVFPLAHTLFQTYPPGWTSLEAERWQHAHTWTDHASQRAPDSLGPSPKGSQWLNDIQQRLTHLWNYLPGDHYQRFGPSLFVLAAIGCWTARRHRAARALLLMIILQLAIWLFATHVYARFAVVLLIPLAALAGLSTYGAPALWRTRIIIMIISLGALWNLMFVLRLHSAESMPQVPASLITQGQLPGFEFIGFVNQELPPDARLLLIGEARPFYLAHAADYHTVFNHHPLAEIAETGSPLEIINWLRETRYTHLLVNWAEVQRLRATYGFSEAITPEMFASLERAGLTLVHAQPHPATQDRYVELYAVPTD